jgi:signal recognition particle subunit SRP54
LFESLSDRLTETFKKFRGQGRLDEKNIQDGLREVRLALLEADVNFKVVKAFIDRIRERALGQDVLKSLTPGQQVVKIVHDELVELLGGEQEGLNIRGAGPHKIMFVGLQGSGKTTSAAKLALHLRRQKHRPYLVPADVYRPAAIDQLQSLAKQLDMPCFPSTQDMDPVDICRNAEAEAAQQHCDVLLFDTAGRLHVDEKLMEELSSIKQTSAPQEILFVADAMTGQDAVTVAESFNERLSFTGVVLTKMDGDARGGAALSIKEVTGASIKFVGMGEKLNEMEVFHPDRVASRILGMGDVLTLIEKAQSAIDEEEAKALSEKMAKAKFDLEDFRTQMRRMKKLGSVEGLLKLIPGMGQLSKQLGEMKGADKELVKVDAMISSMTMEERRNPKILNQSRRRRIASGSGSSLSELSQLLKNFEQMNKMMQKMMGGGKGKKSKLPRIPGFGGAGAPPGAGGMPGIPGMEGLPGMEEAGEASKRALSKKTLKERKRKKLSKKQKKKR